MYDIIEKLLTNVIASLYQYLSASIIMSFLAMFVYIECRNSGIRTAFKKWIIEFRKSKEFRRIFCLLIFISLILFRTIFCRKIWGNPLSSVLGNWSLKFSDGTLSTEIIENYILFIPFTSLSLWAVKDKILHNDFRIINMIFQSTKIAFGFSVCIEICQILFRVGTFQLSDIVTNSLGGLTGGVLYFIAYKINNK